MPYVDIATLQTIATGQPFQAATLQQIRDDLEFLIDPPACSVFNSTSQTVATSSGTVLTADSESFDNDSMHSTSINTGRVTIQTPGRYLLFTTVSFAADADGSRRLDFVLNGSTSLLLFNIPASSAVSAVTITGTRSMVLGAGDYVEVRATHTACNDLEVTLAEFGATFLTR